MESAAIGGCASLGGGSILVKCQNFGTSRIVFALCFFLGLRVALFFGIMLFGFALVMQICVPIRI